MKSCKIKLHALLHSFLLIYLTFSFAKSDSVGFYSADSPNSIEELNEKVNSTYMKDVISDLQSIIDSYAYLDISQNPPNLGYHAKVNLKEVF